MAIPVIQQSLRGNQFLILATLIGVCVLIGGGVVVTALIIVHLIRVLA